MNAKSPVTCEALDTCLVGRSLGSGVMFPNKRSGGKRASLSVAHSDAEASLWRLLRGHSPRLEGGAAL